MLIKLTYLSILALFILAHAFSFTDSNKGIFSSGIFFPDTNVISLQQQSNSHVHRFTHARRSNIIRRTSADGSIVPTISNTAQNNAGSTENVLFYILDYLCQGCDQARYSTKVIMNQKISGYTAIQIFQESTANGNNNGFFGDAYHLVEQLFSEGYITGAPLDVQAKYIAAVIPFLLARMHGPRLQDLLNAVFSDAFPDSYKNTANFAKLIYSSPAVNAVDFASGIDITEVLSGVVAAATIIDGEAVSEAAVVDMVKTFNSQLN